MSMRHLSILLALIFGVLGTVTRLPAENLTLAGPGVRAVIIAPDDWKAQTWSDWGGQNILRRHVEQVTGIRLPLVTAANMTRENQAQYDVRIWVGRQPAVDKVIGQRLDAIDADGFIIHVQGSDVYLAGRNWWGTNWAVYDLLETFANCRWYLMEPRWWQPGTDGYYGPGDLLPKAEAITLPGELDRVEEPDYRSRWFRIAPIHSFRLRRRDQFHHALGKIIPPSKLMESNPELFPIIDGKAWQPRNDNDFQPRVTGDQSMQRVVDAARAYFDENPHEDSFSIGMNDSNRFDNSPQTLALAPEELQTEALKIAWGFWDWYNRIAAEVEKTHPDRRLGCLAYAGLSNLPAGSITLHPMLVPYLTRDSAQLFDPAEVREFHDTVQRWSRLANRMGIYEYMYGGGFVIPRIYGRYLFENIKNRYGTGVDGFYAEAYPNWGLDGPKYWMASKLLWDTSLDPKTLEAEFHDNMFGPAAPVMAEYFAFLEETWCNQTLDSDRSNYRWHQDARQLEIFPPQVCDQAMAMLDEAAALATGPAAQQHDARYAGQWTVAKRVDFFRTSFALTQALSHRYHAANRADAIFAQSPAALGEQIASLEAYQQAHTQVLTRAEAVRALGFSALSTTGVNELDRLDFYDKVPGAVAANVLQQLVDQAIASARPRSVQAINAAIDDIITRLGPAGMMTNQLSKDARTRGYLPVRPTDVSPVIDGEIEPAVWGQPVFDGPFTQFDGSRASVLLPAHRLSPFNTKVWMRYDEKYLYVAAACQQPADTIRAKVTRDDTTHWRQSDMRDDDCLVLSFFLPGTSFATVRVNANGTVADYSGTNLQDDFAQAAAMRTDAGWHVELKIDRHKRRLVSQDDLDGLTLSIARYAHESAKSGQKPALAKAQTMAAYPFANGFIGAGDHPQHMTFRTGMRLVLLQPED